MSVIPTELFFPEPTSYSFSLAIITCFPGLDNCSTQSDTEALQFPWVFMRGVYSSLKQGKRAEMRE